MYEIVHYIFSSFWRWLGAVILLGVIAEGLGGMFRIKVVRTIKNQKNDREGTDNEQQVRGEKDAS